MTYRKIPLAVAKRFQTVNSALDQGAVSRLLKIENGIWKQGQLLQTGAHTAESITQQQPLRPEPPYFDEEVFTETLGVIRV